jgi:GTP-binding protein HflX
MDVLLVGLGDPMDEIRALIEAAGYRLRGEFVQKRTRPDPRSFVGKGKLEELKKAVEAEGVSAVVFAGTLRPSQHFELEKSLKVECFDRLRVILEIFTRRASSREAKLQVELAMLAYEVPILREWIHAGVAGERPGFMAGGEYRVDAYYETVKRRMVKVREALAAIRLERARRRDDRERRGFHQVAIAGYANAGKSSLFNALSGERVSVDDQLFTTLSTTTRTMARERKGVLLTDTVGFVSDVPLWLVEAFQSTFEEAFSSDLLLLLFDTSDPPVDLRRKVRLARDMLPSALRPDRVLPVLAKVDLASPTIVESALTFLRDSGFDRDPLLLSTQTGIGLAELREAILREFQYPIEILIRVRNDGETGAFFHWLHEHTDVLTKSEEDGVVTVRLRCRERDFPNIQKHAEVVTTTTAT